MEVGACAENDDEVVLCTQTVAAPLNGTSFVRVEVFSFCVSASDYKPSCCFPFSGHVVQCHSLFIALIITLLN